MTAALAEIGQLLRSLPGFDTESFDPARVIEQLSDDQVAGLLAPITKESDYVRTHKYDMLFPDEGLYPRHKYPKHIEFFNAGAQYRERCFMAANRVGKTVAGAYETTAHLTGLYKPWWEGRKFSTAIDAWAAGDTNETTRDIIQKELFGEITWGDDGKKCFDGTGMVHRSKIGRITWKSGVQDLADTVEVRHVTGRHSRLGLKSYDQGRRVFQGTAKGWIWLDEECPLDVYGECLYRTATTGGMVALTFTPLLGISETVLSFLPAEMRPDA